MKKALLLIKNWYKSITEPFELIKDNFGSIVAYEVLFRVLAFLVLLPMLGDGTIVVLHDDNLKRTTGVDKNVWEVTYDEIKDLDNGSFFNESFAGTTIPTLDEVMRLAGRGDDKLYLNIEIKRNGHDDGIVEKVIEIIRENNYMDCCDVTSQDYETIEDMRKADPGILTAYTSVIGIGELDSLEAADIISIQETFATYENIDRIHRAGKHVFVWTVNEEDTMKKTCEP